jgi:hypothetical protein
MELTPFASLTLTTGSDGFYMLGDTPAGKRIIQEIHAAELVGDRITASLVGQANADWLAIDGQGVATFDIRLTLKTQDDAIVYLAYSGRADWSEGLGRGPIFVGAEFEAGDERYRWLNALHLFGRGGVADGGVRYDFFQGA